MLALRGAGQKQRDDVGASDQKKQRNGAEEEPQRAAGTCDGGFFELVNRYREVGICFRELLGELVLDGGEVGASLVNGNARLEATDHGEPRGLAALGVRSV